MTPTAIAPSERRCLALADRYRADSQATTPRQMWVVADEDSGGLVGDRVRILYHAFIHAGILKRYGTTDPYEVCPKCGAVLIDEQL